MKKIITVSILAGLLSGCIHQPVYFNPLGILPIGGCLSCPNDGGTTYSYDKTRVRKGVLVESLNRARMITPVIPVGRRY